MMSDISTTENSLYNPLLSHSAANTASQFLERILERTKDILHVLAPRVLANLLSTIGNAYLYGRLSGLSPREDYSAATGLISLVRLVLIIIPSGFFYIVPVSWRNAEDAKKPMVVTNALAVAVSFGLLGSGASLSSHYFFRSIGVDSSVCDIIEEYFNMYAPVFPIHLMAIVFNQAAHCLDAHRLLLVDGLLNVVFLFAFSSFFLKEHLLAIFSSTQIVALSSLLSAVSRFSVYSVSYAVRGDVFEPIKDIISRDHRRGFVSLIKEGVTVCLQLGAESIGSFMVSILVTLMLQQQKMDLSILNVMNQFFTFSIVIPIALGVTALNKVLDAKKSNQLDLIDSYVNICLGLAVFYNIVLILVVMSMPTTFANFFMNPSDNEHKGLSGSFRAIFAITCVGILFDSFKNIINMSFRGLKHYRLGLEVSVFGVLIGLSLAALLGYFLGMAGMLLGFNTCNIFMGSCMLHYWFKKQSIDEQSSLWADVKGLLFKASRESWEFPSHPSCISELG